jgi:UDP-2,4-diacetamido-2,4,6-trideoxy-beta-L-altropyranose hydrolase
VNRRLVFRVLAGTLIGLGHLTRCRNLAEVMQARGWEILWVLDSEAASYFSPLQLPGNYVDAAEGCQAAEDLVVFQALGSDAQRPPVVIIDGYDFDSDYLQRLRKLGWVTVLMDDGLLAGPLPVDLLVNSSYAVSPTKYTGRNVGKVLLGPAYVPVSPAFSSVDLVPLSRRDRVAVTFGGSDPAKLTKAFLLAAEQSLFFADKIIELITGAGNGEVDWIRSHLKVSKLRVNHLHNVADMSHVLGQARVAIAAAGATAHELTAVGIRPQLIIVAENQRENAQAMQQRGLCDLFEDAGTLNWQDVFAKCERSWHLADTECHNRHPDGCDGRGVFRIADTIESLMPDRL